MSPASLRRAAWPLVAGVALVGFLFLAVVPTKTYLAQRRERVATLRKLSVLSEHNGQLEERARLLHTYSEIERLAREQYNLVRPGEEALAILPAPAGPPAGSGEAGGDPAAGPSGHDEKAGSWWSRAWERVVSVL